jgi:hypothetical protein
MLYCRYRMPLVFVIAQDWTLRTAVRAELRERGIDALGMDCAEDIGRAIASGQMPAAVVLEGTHELASSAAIRNLMGRVPTILIASRTEKIPLPEGLNENGAPRKYTGVALYRPVQVGEIVSRVLDILHKPHPA